MPEIKYILLFIMGNGMKAIKRICWDGAFEKMREYIWGKTSWHSYNKVRYHLAESLRPNIKNAVRDELWRKKSGNTD